MSVAIVPMDLLNDENVTGADLLIYLAVSAATPEGAPIEGISGKARCAVSEAVDAVVRLLASGVIRASGGRLFLGTVGGVRGGEESVAEALAVELARHSESMGHGGRELYHCECFCAGGNESAQAVLEMTFPEHVAEAVLKVIRNG